MSAILKTRPTAAIAAFRGIDAFPRSRGQSIAVNGVSESNRMEWRGCQRWAVWLLAIRWVSNSIGVPINGTV